MLSRHLHQPMVIGVFRFGNAGYWMRSFTTTPNTFVGEGGNEEKLKPACWSTMRFQHCFFYCFFDIFQARKRCVCGNAKSENLSQMLGATDALVNPVHQLMFVNLVSLQCSALPLQDWFLRNGLLPRT